VQNWNSEKQIKQYFRSIGIEIPTYKDLDKIYAASKNKTLGDFIAMQELQKSVTTYGENWLQEGYIKSDGRVHGDFNQIVNTGRYSSNNPNLQNLPAGGFFRAAFIPTKGNKFVIGDFSGQEMAIMAAASGEDIWINALLRGEDIHAITASLLFPHEWEAGFEKGCKFPKKCGCAVHAAKRKSTKVLNFMLAYGGGPQKFSEDTGTPMVEARITVNRYKKVVPKVSKWLEKNGIDALHTGISYSADPYRRRRVLFEPEEWQVINQGKNNPVQAAGANMLKLSMASLPEVYKIPVVIHDEIVLDVPNKDVKAAAKALQQVMEKSADYITGIKGLVKAEPRIADNLLKEDMLEHWLKLKK